MEEQISIVLSLEPKTLRDLGPMKGSQAQHSCSHQAFRHTELRPASTIKVVSLMLVDLHQNTPVMPATFLCSRQTTQHISFIPVAFYNISDSYLDPSSSLFGPRTDAALQLQYRDEPQLFNLTSYYIFSLCNVGPIYTRSHSTVTVRQRERDVQLYSHDWRR